MPIQKLSFYQGPYTVELEPETRTDHLPMESVSINGNTVSVPRGTMQQVMGGIQFYADGRPFSWGYKYIRRVKNDNGEVLWQNWNIKD